MATPSHLAAVPLPVIVAIGILVARSSVQTASAQSTFQRQAYLQANVVDPSFDYTSLDVAPLNPGFLERRESFTSFEIAKQHAWYGGSDGGSITDGWRFDAAVNGGRFGFGSEVRTNRSYSGVETATDEPGSEMPSRNGYAASGYSSVGLRAMRFDKQSYAATSVGFVISEDDWTTLQRDFNHYLVGPQLGSGVVIEGDLWRLEALALAVIGYGHAQAARDVQQTGVDRFAVRSTHDEFGWMGESRLTSSCQLTKHVRFDVTWRWYVLSPTLEEPSGFNPGWRVDPSGNETGSDWFLGLTYTR